MVQRRSYLVCILVCAREVTSEEVVSNGLFMVHVVVQEWFRNGSVNAQELFRKSSVDP